MGVWFARVSFGYRHCRFDFVHSVGLCDGRVVHVVVDHSRHFSGGHGA